MNDRPKLKVLDLFSGIGGFSLGLERTGGFRTVAFCEIDPFCRRVLRKHWPNVPIFEDVRVINAEALKEHGIVADVVTGGFPCQDISIAGKRAGIEGKRSGLWSECARLIGELRPRYAIVENVTNLLAGPSERPGWWFGRVLGDLAEIGFDAEWHCIPASAVGAPILRDRVWITAFPHGNRLEGWLPISKAIRRQAALVGRNFWQPIPEHRGHRSRIGIPLYVDRITALGNAVVPQIPEIIGLAILEAEGAMKPLPQSPLADRMEKRK